MAVSLETIKALAEDAVDNLHSVEALHSWMTEECAIAAHEGELCVERIVAWSKEKDFGVASQVAEMLVADGFEVMLSEEGYLARLTVGGWAS